MIPIPFFSAIVLFKNRPFPPGVWRFSRRKDPWKEWKWRLPLELRDTKGEAALLRLPPKKITHTSICLSPQTWVSVARILSTRYRNSGSERKGGTRRKRSRATVHPSGCSESHRAVAQKLYPEWNPGKWKHGPNPAVCPGTLILNHIHISFSAKLRQGLADRKMFYRSFAKKSTKNQRVWVNLWLLRILRLVWFQPLVWQKPHFSVEG